MGKPEHLGNVGVRSLEQSISCIAWLPLHTFIDCICLNQEVLVKHLLFCYTVVQLKWEKKIYCVFYL